MKKWKFVGFFEGMTKAPNDKSSRHSYFSFDLYSFRIRLEFFPLRCCRLVGRFARDAILTSSAVVLVRYFWIRLEFFQLRICGLVKIAMPGAFDTWGCCHAFSTHHKNHSIVLRSCFHLLRYIYWYYYNAVQIRRFFLHYSRCSLKMWIIQGLHNKRSKSKTW